MSELRLTQGRDAKDWRGSEAVPGSPSNAGAWVFAASWGVPGAGARVSNELGYPTNLYPSRCTVIRNCGSDGSSSIFLRSLAMWVSTVRVNGMVS